MHLSHQNERTRQTQSQRNELHVPRCVTPDANIVQSAESYTWVGGRGGCLHRDDGSLRPQRWVSECWTYYQYLGTGKDSSTTAETIGDAHDVHPLSFLDEVTALAAGHRPCEHHQARDAKNFFACWGTGASNQAASWEEVDRVLHLERLDEFNRKKTLAMPVHDLPDGSMFRASAGSYLCLGNRHFLWSTRGYVAQAQLAADSVVEVLTPTSLISTLHAGYEPDIHESVLKFL